MAGLGYEKYGAHGNDAGSFVAPELGRVDPEHVVGVHVDQIYSFPSGDPAEFAGMSEDEMAELTQLQEFGADKMVATLTVRTYRSLPPPPPTRSRRRLLGCSASSLPTPRSGTWSCSSWRSERYRQEITGPAGWAPSSGRSRVGAHRRRRTRRRWRR